MKIEGVFRTCYDILAITSTEFQKRSFKVSTEREFEDLQLSCWVLLLIHPFDRPYRPFKQSTLLKIELICNKILAEGLFVKFLIKEHIDRCGWDLESFDWRKIWMKLGFYLQLGFGCCRGAWVVAIKWTWQQQERGRGVDYRRKLIRVSCLEEWCVC